MNRIVIEVGAIGARAVLGVAAGALLWLTLDALLAPLRVLLAP